MGIKTSDVYGGNWINKETLEDGNGGYKSLRLTIADAILGEVENEGKVKKQIVLLFADDEHRLGLNVTNCTTLEDLFQSKDTDGWMGKKIEIFFDPSVMYAGKKVGGVRIRGIGTGAASADGPATTASKLALSNAFYVWSKLEVKNPAFKAKLAEYCMSSGYELGALTEKQCADVIGGINAAAVMGYDVDTAIAKNKDLPF